ncbi:MAG: molybdopterin-synthase adenylyltransferase MoeB [Acidobacteriota bacterium]
MAAKVYIPTALRTYVNNQEWVELEGSSVEEILAGLTGHYPSLKPHLFTEEGRLRNFVNVYKNDEDIRYLEREKTPVADGDILSIVPSIAGGAFQAQLPVEELTPDEIQRYSRHLIMPEVGMAGQKKLKAASVLCIGAGGLGSPLALYLTAAGVGRLGMVDFDVVDFSNLQRQLLHSTQDVGRPKLESAREKLEAINPHVRLETHETRLTSENALDLLSRYDIIADGTDNFPTRYLVNDACVLSRRPNVYGSIFRFEGQASVFATEEGPCYRCLYPEPPPPGLVPSCAEGGVLGILPGLVGMIQATEVVKLILNKGNSLAGRLLLFDALDMKFRELKLRRDPACPLCGENPSIHELVDYEQFCGVADQQERDGASVPEITATELKEELESGQDLFILDVRNPPELDICRLEGASLIPLGELVERVHELDSARETVVYCRSGQRSAQAIRLLQAMGFRKLRNLRGGILAWADQVDPTMPRY